MILLPIVTPNMYIMQIINMIGIYIILGIGINVLTGYTGQLSLGQAAFFGIGAYTAALMNTRAGLQFIPCLLGSVVVTAFFGVVLAIPALKVKGSYLALLTMGFGEVVYCNDQLNFTSPTAPPVCWVSRAPSSSAFPLTH